MSRYTHIRDLIPSKLRNCSEWPDIATTSLDDVGIRRFKQLRELIGDYLAGLPTQAKLKSYKIHRQILHRQIKRCTTLAPDGHIFGWRALISGLRLGRYERRAPTSRREGSSKVGFAGALTQLFATYPEIQEEIDATLSKDPKGSSIPEAKIAYTMVHLLFLKLCTRVLPRRRRISIGVHCGLGQLRVVPHAHRQRALAPSERHHWDEAVTASGYYESFSALGK